MLSSEADICVHLGALRRNLEQMSLDGIYTSSSVGQGLSVNVFGTGNYYEQEVS